MRVRVATFNVENLFARFRFRGKRFRNADGGYSYRKYTKDELAQIARDGWAVDKTRFVKYRNTEREITAKAIKATKADIIGLQEVENLDVLKRFASQTLGSRYKYRMVIDGNDPRFIDVGLLSKYPFAYIRTHQFRRTANNRSFVFSRDCLEVGVQLRDDLVLPVFVNHFKSMLGGRQQTMARRRVQSKGQVEILKERFGDDLSDKPWVVMGDLNDYAPSSGLAPLLDQPWQENVIDRLADGDRWTHYWAGGNEYKPLDYLILPRGIAQNAANRNTLPVIERRGMPKRASRYTGPRFDGVGQRKPKASDHCPVWFDLEV